MNTPIAFSRPLFSGIPLEQSRAHGATKVQFLWLCSLLLSFCYELPLAEVTQFHRVNPRLFDIVVALGVIFVLPFVRLPRPVPPLFKVWALLVGWYVVCAVVWAALWLSWAENGIFSLFFAARYLQGLLAIYLVVCIPLSPRQKRILQYMAIVGGIVVAVYAIPEYLRGGTVRQLTEEKELKCAKGTLFSCLGPVYTHLAMFGALSLAMALSLVALPKRVLPRAICVALGLFLAWPAMACGSRAGLIGAVAAVIVAFVFLPKVRVQLAVGTMIVSVFLVSGAMHVSKERLVKMSYSFQRLVTIGVQGEGNTIWHRIANFRIGGEAGTGGYSLAQYRWQGWRLPVFGGGFYVVPHMRNDALVYRRGYGIPHIYLFPLEQGGVVAFGLFGWFLWVSLRDLRRMTKLPPGEDQAFASGVWIFYVVMLTVGLAGCVFWQGFGSENMNTYILAMLVLATKPTMPALVPPRARIAPTARLPRQR